MWVIFVGIAVHVVFFMSVFDIYFTSPIVHGMTPHSSLETPPSRRLVLFVADGLRADTFFEKSELCPKLRQVIEDRGAWGVSHTRVPTETRPGHVALIAGLYEDPSAVAKGWKENPVKFDSLFNQSRETWSWGSPDVLPMFSKGASGSHVWMDMYDAEMQDFSGKENTSRLDLWVFDHVKKFLHEAHNNKTLLQRLHKDKIIFFLHLLGLDTCGHTHKPYSKEYEENMRVVDQGVHEMEELFEKFYNFDNHTAYVFTSDHGMTDWGSHGAGDIHETMTPLVVWGSGVSGPHPAIPRRSPASPSSWGLGHLARRDVTQADLTPLMSSLLGIPIPVNNVGVLPKEYLNIPEQKLADAVFANARQIAAHYTYKRKLLEINTVHFLYRPFPDLADGKEEALIDEIHSNIYGGRYREAIALSEILMKTCLSGLTYYETYYQALLLTCVTLAYLGWICWLLTSVLLQPVHDYKKFNHLNKVLEGGILINGLFLSLCAGTVFLVWLQNMPPQMFVYCTLPEVLWWAVIRQHSLVLPAIRALKSSFGSVWQVIGIVILCIAGVEILVVAFYWRAVLSLAMLVLALWPLVFYRHVVPRKILLLWIASSLGIAVFPALPIVGKASDRKLVQLAGLLWLVLSGIATATLHCIQGLERHSAQVLVALAMCLLLAVWNIHSVDQSIEMRKGLPFFNQMITWVLSGLAFVFPLFGSRLIFPRLLSLGLALYVPFLMMSASHESLFLLALALHMLCWLFLETYLAPRPCSISGMVFDLQDSVPKSDTSVHEVSFSDFRKAYFFLFYVILSFFGIGNVASINSFDPTWLRCFITVFSPFVMGSLALFRIMIPIFLVTCMFRAQNVVCKVPADRLFLLMLVQCDLLGTHFLHLVTNQGSWLDIGTSISHFVIVQFYTLFLLLLYWISKLCTGVQLFSAHSDHSSFITEQVSLESGGKPTTGPTNCLLESYVALAKEHSSSHKRHFE